MINCSRTNFKQMTNESFRRHLPHCFRMMPHIRLLFRLTTACLCECVHASANMEKWKERSNWYAARSPKKYYIFRGDLIKRGDWLWNVSYVCLIEFKRCYKKELTHWLFAAFHVQCKSFVESFSVEKTKRFTFCICCQKVVGLFWQNKIQDSLEQLNICKI